MKILFSGKLLHSWRAKKPLQNQTSAFIIIIFLILGSTSFHVIDSFFYKVFREVSIKWKMVRRNFSHAMRSSKYMTIVTTLQ